MNSKKNLTQKIAVLALCLSLTTHANRLFAGCDKCSIYIGEPSPTSQEVNPCEDTLIVATAPINCIDPINVGTGTATGMTNLPHVAGMCWDTVTLVVTGSCIHGGIHSRSVTVELVYPPPTCGSDNSTCSDAPGSMTLSTDCSIRGRISLGRAPIHGQYGGHIELYANELPNSNYYTPAALKIKGGVGLDVVRFGYPDPQIAQIMAPECFVRIEPEDEYRYHISYYNRDNVHYSETLGMYVFFGKPQLIVRHTVENPDGTNGFRRLRFSEERAGQIKMNEFMWTQEPGGPVQWGLSEGDGVRHKALHVEESGQETIKTWTVSSPSSGDASVTRRVYAQRGELKLPIRAIVDPDGAALTTSYEYTDSGQLRLTVNPDGSWNKRIYSGGLVSERRSGWLDAGTNAADEAVQTTAYDYAPFLVDAAAYPYPDNGATDPGTPRVETVIAVGVPVAKTLRVIYTDTMGYKSVEEVRLADPSTTNHAAAYADPANPRTVRTYMPKSDDSLWSERPEAVRHPDGRTENTTYVLGDYAPGDADAPGSFTENPFGTCLRVTLTHGTTNAPDGIAYRTTREVAFETLVGRTLQSETHLYNGSDYERIAWRKNTLNDLGQIVATYSSDGSQTETTWGCCGPAFETAADGTTTTTTYDALQRPILSDRDGENHNLYTETAYDAAGRTTYRRTFAGDLAQSTTNTYDLTGRLTWSRGPDGIETAYSYGSNATTTIRGALTNLSVRFADGRAHYSEQNGLRQQTYAYGLDASSPGCQTTTVFSGPDGADSSAWSKTVSDPLGRTIAQIRPAFLALSGAEGASGAGVPPALLVTSNSYNLVGHLVKTERRVSGVESRLLDVTLYTYDSLGQPLLTCQDLDLDGEITLAGPDRVSGSAAYYHQIGANWWHETVSWIYPENGSDLVLTNSLTRRRLTGLGSPHNADGADGILSAESISIDIHGNETIIRSVVNRDAKSVYQLVYTPNSTVATLSTTVNGLLVASRSSSGNTTTYTYDALGRQTATQDARGSIHARGYDTLGRVAWETDPATNGTWYAYDDLGRRTAVTNALGEVTHTAYDAEGRVIKTYGATYPVEYGYDAFGRMVSMKTFRDEQGAGDETRWFYEEATGLLTNKVYADLSAEQAGGKGTAYSYTPDGKLASRAWARGVTTEYNYAGSGELSGIDYSDDTPEVSFAYDRLGRMASAIVAGISTNAYTYDQETLALIMETQNGMEITRTTDTLGRDTGFSLGSDYSVQYGYDAYGRFSSVTSSVSSASLAVQYTRLANSELLSGRSVEIGNSLLAVGYSYEAARSLITSVENRFGETVISRYDYANDELGRRTFIERLGLAFGDIPVRDAYGYNPRSEVVSARRTPIGSQTELRGFSYDYEYDPIGNRVTSTEYDHEDSALVSSYAANALNQYEQRSIPGYAGVRGSATNTATVTVNGNPTWRYGEYFYGGDAADNSADAVMKQLEITATYSNLFTSVTGRVFVAETPEAFTYDDDGNLTQDGRFDYTWNGENRLIKAETRDDLPASVPRVKVEYQYDHQGRMVWKQVSTNAVVLSTRTLLWDGYNIVQARTHSQTHTLTNFYTWGLDLSGTLQGAGGVGGLLAEVQDGVPYFAAFDANGNITEYVSTNGTIVAHYEYSPFGEMVVQSGDLADSFTHRFSTKPWCAVTGLSEYEMRKYGPGMGRWLSMDPIGERGGLHLYAFVGNSPINLIDPLGDMEWYKKLWAMFEIMCRCYGSELPAPPVEWIPPPKVNVTKVVKKCGGASSIVFIYFSLTTECGAPDAWKPGFGGMRYYYNMETGQYDIPVAPDGAPTALPKEAQCSKEEQQKCCPCEITTETEPVEGRCPFPSSVK